MPLKSIEIILFIYITFSTEEKTYGIKHFHIHRYEQSIIKTFLITLHNIAVFYQILKNSLYLSSPKLQKQ